MKRIIELSNKDYQYKYRLVIISLINKLGSDIDSRYEDVMSLFKTEKSYKLKIRDWFHTASSYKKLI